MFGPELIDQLKPREARFQETARSAFFFLRRQLRNFENMTVAARRKEHFRGFWADFFVAELPQKIVCLFVCLFVCWNKTRNTILRLLLGGK